jgi:hypothetical protein
VKTKFLQVSLGNKTLALFGVFGAIILILCFVFPFKLEGALIGLAIVISFSFISGQVTFISLNNNEFLIESLFKFSIVKDAFLFDEVVEIIPFSHLMKIKFKDGSSYLFWGKSENELNQEIRNKIG